MLRTYLMCSVSVRKPAGNPMENEHLSDRENLITRIFDSRLSLCDMYDHLSPGRSLMLYTNSSRLHYESYFQ